MNPLLKKVYDAQAAEYSRGNQDLVDYTVTAVLNEVANYLKENDFVSVDESLPVLEDWDYARADFIIVRRMKTGGLRTCPGQYQRSVVRKKRVERWTDAAGRVLTDVAYWKKYPEPPQE